jgi:hypothetical protein
MNLWRSVLKALDGWTTWGGSGVADEAEAFLQGRLLERMLSCGAGGQAPGWMWLNAVAHGNREQVEMLATVCADKVKPTGGWRGARRGWHENFWTRLRAMWQRCGFSSSRF